LVGEQKTINLTLVESIKNLDEVVVIGYGSVTKRELTGSVASVKEEDFNPGAVSDALELVQGKVAGLSVTKMDGGDPTKGYEISLRGATSLNGSTEPLVVIDGIPGGSLEAISPGDIESIDILKDGSAAAIYGTRGTNGVILITTKKGKKGRTYVELSARALTERVLNRLEPLTRDEYLAMKTEFENSDSPAKRSIADGMIDYGEDTDWFEEILRDNPIGQNYNLAIGGGSENTSYRVSFDFNKREGILLNNNSQDLRIISNIQQQAINNKVKFSVQMGLTDEKTNPVDYNAVRQTIQRNPTESVYNKDGSLTEYIGAWQYDNPVGILTERVIDNAGSRVFGNLGVDVMLAKSFKINVVAGLNRNRILNGYYAPSYSLPMETGGIDGSANRWAGSFFNKTFESTLEWKKTMAKHNLSLLGGYAYEYIVNEEFYASNSNFISDDLLYNNLGLGTFLSEGRAEMKSYKEESTLTGFFARGSYSYDNKYYLSGSIRREGSSKFGTNYKWGIFPAVSAAWDISQESFFENISGLVQFLKVRAGYGVTGNQGLDDFYIPMVRYKQDDGFFYYNGEKERGYVPESNANPDLRWETKTEYNVGLDWLLYNSKIGGTIDFYIRDTKDLLMLYDVPQPPNLAPEMWANVATMRNSGLEFTVNATPVQMDKFSWNFTFLFDSRNNKILSIQDEEGYYTLEYLNQGDVGAPGISAWTHRVEEDEPVGNIHTYRYLGFDEEGLWIFDDINNDTTIDTEDRTVVGNGVPDYYLGFTNTFKYGKIDLSIMLRGMFGHQIINAKRIWHGNPKFLPRNVLKEAMNTELWDDPEFSSYYVEDGDFVKVDNITLGYTHPFNNKYIKSVRLYGSVNNAFVFTKYTGLDPEVSFKGLEAGNDNRFDYPSVRTFIIGLNVKF
jgi:TonB-linked SusC/RagA family outer membrane protein